MPGAFLSPRLFFASPRLSEALGVLRHLEGSQTSPTNWGFGLTFDLGTGSKKDRKHGKDGNSVVAAVTKHGAKFSWVLPPSV